MIRITQLSGKLYGKDISYEKVYELWDDIQLVEKGNPVILVEELSELAEFGIDFDLVIML